MTQDNFEFNPNEIISAYMELSDRCLYQSASWILAFLPPSIPNSHKEDRLIQSPSSSPVYLMAKELFSMGEFQKVEYSLRDSTIKDQKAIGLKFLAKSLNLQRELDQNISDNVSFLGPLPVSENSRYDSFSSIIQEMKPLYDNQQLDPINIYIYASILVKGGRFKDAAPIVIQSINGYQMNRSAYKLLLTILLRLDNDFISKTLALFSPQASQHWMTNLFKIELFSETGKADELSLPLFEHVLTKQKVPRNPHIIALEAKMHYYRNDSQHSQDLFEELRQTDPLCFDYLELYSNLLFVKEDVSALSELSQSLAQIDKYRPETLAISGNFYAINGCHEDAISNLAMALRQDSSFAFVWTLIGHEFVELENITAAMAAYSRAHEHNQHDYRALYGLGRIYDMSKMTHHANVHYKNAALVNPNDWRMWFALAITYEELNEYDNSLVCFKKALTLKDCDIDVYFRIGVNYYNRSEEEIAAFYFEKYVNLSKPGSDGHLLSDIRVKDVKFAISKLKAYYTELGNQAKIEELEKTQTELESSFSEVDIISSSLMSSNTS